MAEITVRKVKFEFPDELDDVLPGDDLAGETYLVAFSLTMPYLEPYLIRTYRSVLDEITDPVLADDVRKFIGQEAQHFQNHRRVNEMIKGQLGPEVAAKLQKCEDDLEADYRRFNVDKSRRFNLVYAEGFEAMTCAMAMTMFADASAGTGLGSNGRFGAWQNLWAWHAAEEIEHRTVAFNVFEHLEGSYPYRVTGSLRAQAHFHRCVDRMQRILLEARGESRRPRTPPWLRNGRSRYLATFRKGYDPGQLTPDPMVDMVLSNYAA
ncbi:MAG: metal-dependent hydrolase [Ilumatobacteraceae bacterium]